jgi:DNA-binding protein H-NS
MATLAAMKRQIAKLEAEVVRKTREEMSGAIAKVREIMTTFGLTVEHLTSGGHDGAKKVSTKKSAAKKVKGKRAGAGTPKYRNPKSGATWTGFGRAPGWITSAKSRDAFLIDKPVSEAAAIAATAKAAATKKVAKKAAV